MSDRKRVKRTEVLEALRALSAERAERRVSAFQIADRLTARTDDDWRESPPPPEYWPVHKAVERHLDALARELGNGVTRSVTYTYDPAMDRR